MPKSRNGWTRRELAATLAALGAARILPAAVSANPTAKVPVKLSKRQKDVLKKAVADTATVLAKVRGAVLPDDVPPAFVIPMPDRREKRS